MDETLKIRLNQLYMKIEPLIKEGSALQKELRNRKEKRNILNRAYNVAREEALAQRESRDELNKKVKDLKDRMRILNIELSEKRERQRTLKDRLSLLKPQARKEEEALKKINSLEWKIQTTPMNVDLEKKIIDQIKHLEKNLQDHKEAESLREQLDLLKPLIRDYERSISQLREEKNQLVEEGDNHHKNMLNKFKEAKEKKKKADQAHKSCLELEEKLAASQKHYLEIMTEIKSIENSLDEELEKRKIEKVERIERQIEEEALEKLKKKKKMTIDELKMLIKHDHLNTE